MQCQKQQQKQPASWNCHVHQLDHVQLLSVALLYHVHQCKMQIHDWYHMNINVQIEAEACMTDMTPVAAPCSSF
jgi:hypothetical protein